MRKKRRTPEKPKHSALCGRRLKLSNRKQEEKTNKAFYKDHDFIVTYVVALLQDGLNRFSFIRTADSLRDIATVKARYDQEGLGFITKVLPSLWQSLCDYMEGRIPDYSGFKKAGPKAPYPAFLRQFFARIYDEKTDEADKAMYIDHIFQICVAFKKLKGPYRNVVLRKQLADFVDTDIELRYLDLTSEANARVINIASGYIYKVFRDFDLDEGYVIPRPGPGATNTHTEKNVRWRPHVLYDKLNDSFPYEDWFYDDPWAIVADPKKHPFRLPREDAPMSRFKFVPKTFSKPRGICIEQLETQYFQQGLRNALCTIIERHPLTRGRINFNDQKVNGRLALEHSLTREFATIDMKEASDRISRALVSKLFRKVPHLRELLMSVSTELIEMPGDVDINFIPVLPAAKFAPMGSAVCFPVMGVVHWALIRAILFINSHRSQLDDIYVYGDDIIIPSNVYEEVITTLPNFGMKLNTTKSFINSFFRESCGVNAYYGREITPVYFKNIPTPKMNAKVLVGLLNTEGQLYRKGYTDTAALLRTEIRRHDPFGLDLPYVNARHAIPGFIRDEPLLLDPRSLSRGLRSKWDQETQCRWFKVKVMRPVLDVLPPLRPDEGLLRFKCVGSTGSVNTDPGTTYIPFHPHFSGSALEIKIKRQWLPESALNPLLRNVELGCQ